MTQEQVADVASSAAYAGAGLTVASAAPHYVFGLSMDEWSVLGIISGMAIGAIGLVVNASMRWYFESQRLKLDRKAAEVDASRS